MAKCIRCGKSTLVRGHVKLADGAICTPCWKSLGFKITETATSSLYRYDDIKDGRDAYDQRQWAKRSAEFARNESERLGLYYADYDTLEALDCSDNEMRTVERICALLEDEGCRTNRISCEREPGAPLSAYVGDKKLFELKYTKDVKWIRIGDSEDKNRITGPAGINKLVNKLIEAYNR